MEVVAASIVVGVVSSAFYEKNKIDQQKKQTKIAGAAAERAYEIDKQQTELTLAEERRKNLSLLNQQLSTYKAKFGSLGLNNQKGSNMAVLNATKKEHDMEDKYLQNQANLSLEALLNGIETTRSRNLLTLKSLSSESKQSTVDYVTSLPKTTSNSVLY